MRLHDLVVYGARIPEGGLAPALRSFNGSVGGGRGLKKFAVHGCNDRCCRTLKSNRRTIGGIIQEAYDYRDGNIYSALQLESAPHLQGQLHGALRCCFCHERAHFRSRSADRRVSPCFFCRPHGDNCDITRQDSDPWGDDDEARIEHAAGNGGRLIVKINDGASSDEGNDFDGGSQTADTRTGQRSRRGSRQTNNIQRGPQRILELLLSSPRFRGSSVPVRFKDGSELPINQAFVNFENASHLTHTNSWRGFWGKLTYPSRWNYGGAYYFNYGANDLDFRISMSDAQLAQIMERYGLSSVNDLFGGWFILFDIARITNSGRFTAEVLSLNHVGFVRA